jgi:hypothetical protein
MRGCILRDAGVEYTGWTDELFAGESISWIMVLPCFCAKDIIKLSARTRISVYGNLTFN